MYIVATRVRGQNMDEQKKPNAAIVGLIALVVIGLIVAGVFLAGNSNNQESSTQSASPATGTNLPSEVAESSTQSDVQYADGDYNASGSYGTPGGQESVDVTLTIKDGVVTSADVTGSGERGESEQYQSQFISGYKSQVVGKPIESIKLDRVAGSSLTSDGFNAAVEKIRQEAATV